jgi:hypothetical protein
VPAVASSKGTAETPTIPGTPSIAGRPGTGIHQELKYASKSSDTMPEIVETSQQQY